MKITLLCFIAFTTIGCASNGEKKNSTAKNDIGYKCVKIAVTGTMFPKKYCSTKNQRNEAAEKGKELLKESRGIHIIDGNTPIGQ